MITKLNFPSLIFVKHPNPLSITILSKENKIQKYFLLSLYGNYRDG